MTRKRTPLQRFEKSVRRIGGGLRHYILDAEHRLVETDMMSWAHWFETTERQVALTRIGDMTVSTVFLGLDHNWGDGPPICFETMIFGPDRRALDQLRYASWDDALTGHKAVVSRMAREMGQVP